jgi:hypothetical protein
VQVEGAWDEGGRSPSIWDTFSQQPGHTYGNATGNVAAGHFHQYEQDIKLMLALGVKHYRCASSSSRCQAHGSLLQLCWQEKSYSCVGKIAVAWWKPVCRYSQSKRQGAEPGVKVQVCMQCILHCVLERLLALTFLCRGAEGAEPFNSCCCCGAPIYYMHTFCLTSGLSMNPGVKQQVCMQ